MTELKVSVNGQPFLGRLEEQTLFQEALRTVHEERNLISKVKDWAIEKKEPLPFIFLLYGEGGMGKTYLTRRLLDIVENDSEFAGKFNTLWLDWEKRRDLDYALKVRDSVSPEKVFEHIYSIFRDNGYGSSFSEYENSLTVRSEAEAKVSQVLDKNIDGGERFKTLKDLGGKGISWLIRSGIVGGVPIPVPDEPTAELFKEIIGKGAESIARARENATILLRSTLNQTEFDMFTMPHEKLARTLANGIRKSSSSKPIVFLLDTYEISNRADAWVREVIRDSGSNLVWVISGRDNLADSRKFGSGYFNGYRNEFSTERLKVYSLTEFSVDEVLNYLTHYVPEREVNHKLAQDIHRATLGIPLAVQVVSFIWKSGTNLNDIVKNVPEKAKRDEIVKLMTERFLLHCFDDPAHPNDLKNIYALALAYSPDPDLLKAMMQVEDLEKELSDLERRHSFVFLNQLKLHSSVQSFLREYLMHPLHLRSKYVQNINHNAVEYLITICAQKEKELILLEKVIEDDLWKEVRLGLIHHTFWVNPDDGWKSFLPGFVAGLVYDSDFARACVENVKSVFEILKKPEKNRFDVFRRGLSESTTLENKTDMIGRLEIINSDVSGQVFEDEISFYLDILRGNVYYRQKKYSDALNKYDVAEKKLMDNSDKAKKLLGLSLYSLAQTLVDSNPKRENLWFDAVIINVLNKAINWMEHKHLGYNKKGDQFVDMEKYKEAIDAYQKSIEIKNDDPDAYYGLAVVYRNKRDIEKSIEYCLKGLDINPKDRQHNNGLGYLYNKKGKYDLAIKHLEEVAENPFSPMVLINLGISTFLVGKTEEAYIHFKKAIELSKDGEKHTAVQGWAEVVIGDLETGTKLIEDSLDRKGRIVSAQNLYDWTKLLAKASQPPKGIEYLLNLINTNPLFKKLNKFDID